MSANQLARLIAHGGRIAEPAPPAPALAAGAEVFGGSVQVRFINAGGCSDCALEVMSAFGPVYDVERYGIRLVASPRHADVLLITGAVTRNILEPLRRTIEATPTPRFVIAVGDCAITGGVAGAGYGVVGPVSSIVDVDLEVPGSPPEPAQIVEALRRMTGR
jgi:Ni,Fe-hydrogenase III small subunit